MIHESLVVHPSIDQSLCGIYMDFVLCRVAVNDEPGGLSPGPSPVREGRFLRFGIGEAEVYTALSGCELCADAVVEGHTVVIRQCDFVLVGQSLSLTVD